MKLIKKLGILHWICLLSFMLAVSVCWSRTPQQILFGLRLKDEGAAPSTPPSGYGEVYVNSDALCFKNDSGTVTTLSAGTGDNALDDAYDQGGAGAGRTITIDATNWIVKSMYPTGTDWADAN